MLENTTGGNTTSKHTYGTPAWIKDTFGFVPAGDLTSKYSKLNDIAAMTVAGLVEILPRNIQQEILLAKFQTFLQECHGAVAGNGYAVSPRVIGNGVSV